MNRALYLYYLSLSGAWHRLRADLGGEVVVFTSSLVLLATFSYIFNDFLNVQIASLSADMRRFFATFASYTLLIGSTLAAGRRLHKRRYEAQSLQKMAQALGEGRTTSRLFQVLNTATLLVVWHGLAWYLSYRYCVQWPPQRMISLELTMLLLSLGGTWIHPGKTHDALAINPPSSGYAKSTPIKPKSRLQVLWTWRLKQIVLRNHATQACLLVAALCWLAVWLAAISGLPAFVACFSALMGGFFAAAPLCLQLAEDLHSAWTERALGVTHDELVTAYVRLGLSLGLACGLPASLIHLLASADAEAAARTLLLALTPGLVMPYIMLQIDARRPAIGLMVGFIASLFLGTALYAHWLCLLIPVLLRPYARNMQAGRFYRA